MGSIAIVSPNLTPEQNRLRIGREGSKSAKKRFAANRQLFRQLMRDIELEITNNGGIYPYAKGKLTISELVRRAGKAEAYLRKSEPPELIQLRLEVQAWVSRVTSDIASSRRDVRKNVTEGIRERQHELANVMQCYAEAEVQLTEALAQLEAANKRVAELEASNNSFLEQLSERKIVNLKPRRT